MVLLSEIRHPNGVTERFDTHRHVIAVEHSYALGHWETGKFVEALSLLADVEDERCNLDTARHFRAFAQILSSHDTVTLTVTTEV